MDNRQPTEMELIIETHIGLERQGPGSPETIRKALGFLGDLSKIAKTADLACGTGGQTMVIAKSVAGSVTGLDICPEFIGAFNRNAEKAGLNGRVKGIVGDMENLPFEKDSFDLIWSEGAINEIGFERGLTHWRGFLKQGGYIAVSCPSWLTGERPEEAEGFWAVCGGLDGTDENIAAMKRAGYGFVAAFTLPDECWTENYFVQRAAEDVRISGKYAGSEAVRAYVRGNEYEEDLYMRFGKHYGYVFYIGKKL